MLLTLAAGSFPTKRRISSSSFEKPSHFINNFPIFRKNSGLQSETSQKNKSVKKNLQKFLLENQENFAKCPGFKILYKLKGELMIE